jgi:hypothetical protein
MLMSMLWGVFGATWFLFALGELGVNATVDLERDQPVGA